MKFSTILGNKTGYIDSKYPEIPAAIRDTRVLSEDTEALLVKAIKECKEQR